jgi:glycosyltransferase involved in cell wall biosynthesis
VGNSKGDETTTEPPGGRDSCSPAVTVAICTRNRGALVLNTISAILAGEHSDFMVVVIDQSDDSVTECAVSTVRDRRVHYLRTSTRGVSEARNVALALNPSPLLAFTDDDCEPSRGWLKALHAESLQNGPGPAIFFGPLVADQSLAGDGMVPGWIPARTRVNRRPWRDYCLGGFGGNMALNREAIALVGRFSPRLGRGAELTACEEGDAAFRLSQAGGIIRELDKGPVLHRGVVKSADVPTALKNDFGSTGHVLGWNIRRGHLAALTQLSYCLGREARVIGTNLLFGTRPLGVRRPLWLVAGLLGGLVDGTPLLPGPGPDA